MSEVEAQKSVSRSFYSDYFFTNLIGVAVELHISVKFSLGLSSPETIRTFQEIWSSSEYDLLNLFEVHAGYSNKSRRLNVRITFVFRHIIPAIFSPFYVFGCAVI